MTPSPSTVGPGGSLADVLPSIAGVMGVSGFEDRLGLGEMSDRWHSTVVLLVDGLGWNALLDHADRAPTLAGASAIAASVPTTTATGLTSLGTGLPAAHHGMVGASFWLPETDAVLHPLSWRDDPHPVAVQPEPTVFERAAAAGIAVEVVSPRAYAGSGLSEAALRGGRYRGADSVGERLAEVASALSGPQPTICYCYWSDLDRTGHVHGVDSDHWRDELQHVDDLVRRLRERLPRDASLVVTADHGMVDCQDVDRIDVDVLGDLRSGVHRLAGEPRFRHVYARRGAADEVRHGWRETLDDRAWVLGRDEAVSQGLFGDTQVEDPARIGDVVAVARDHWALVSPRTDSIVSSLRGQHGALTDDEVRIPLAVLGGH